MCMYLYYCLLYTTGNTKTMMQKLVDHTSQSAKTKCRIYFRAIYISVYTFYCYCALVQHAYLDYDIWSLLCGVNKRTIATNRYHLTVTSLSARYNAVYVVRLHMLQHLNISIIYPYYIRLHISHVDSFKYMYRYICI